MSFNVFLCLDVGAFIVAETDAVVDVQVAVVVGMYVMSILQMMLLL